MFVDLDGLLNA